jgi:hypothetical protein
VLVVTPASLESPVMRREIRLARQEGKTVSPIKGPGIVDPNKLPRWLGQLYDLDLPEHLNKLLGVLALPSRQKRTPMMAPERPTDFVERPVEFDTLKQTLLDSNGDAAAISAALKGAGGYGKTTLAKALAHDKDIQDAYFDGVLWVELGEHTENLLSVESDLVEILTGGLKLPRSSSALAPTTATSCRRRRTARTRDRGVTRRAWRAPPEIDGDSSDGRRSGVVRDNFRRGRVICAKRYRIITKTRVQRRSKKRDPVDKESVESSGAVRSSSGR